MTALECYIFTCSHSQSKSRTIKLTKVVAVQRKNIPTRRKRKNSEGAKNKITRNRAQRSTGNCLKEWKKHAIEEEEERLRQKKVETKRTELARSCP